MNRRVKTKCFILFLVLIVFITNSAFAYSAETNFWKERQQQTQLASLPQPLPNLSTINKPLTAKIKHRRVNQWLPSFSSQQLKDVLTGLPLQFGSVRQISGDTDNIVIHIQDVHMNSEAQSNIGGAIQQLVQSGKVDLIALEGAFGPIDLSPYRNFPHTVAVQAVADYLFKEQKISGPIHSALTMSEKIPPIVGVDDKSHYEANVRAVQKSAPLKESLKKELMTHDARLRAMSHESMNPELWAFHEKVLGYRDGNLTIGEFVKYLRHPGMSLIQDPGLDPGFRQGDVFLGKNIELFLEALQIEKSLNFSQVEHERSVILKDLLMHLIKRETQNLMDITSLFRAGQITHGDFYSYLKNLCEQNKVDLNRTHAMRAYLQYVLLSESINGEKLSQEIRLAEKAIYADLAKTEEEKNLIAQSRENYLKTKLVDFALTKSEWREYTQLDFSSPREGGGQEGGGNAPTPAPSPKGRGIVFGFGELRTFEQFYQEAEIRDQKMAENLQRAIKKHNAKTTVLVTGGFHAKGIRQMLRSRDAAMPRSNGAATQQRSNAATVISFIPKISKVNTAKGGASLSVFTQQKTPLDQLFAGDILFLPPPAVTSDKSLMMMTLMASRAFFEKLHTVQRRTQQWVWTMGVDPLSESIKRFEMSPRTTGAILSFLTGALSGMMSPWAIAFGANYDEDEFEDEESTDFTEIYIRVQALKKVLPQLSPEARAVVLEPNVLLTLLDEKPLYLRYDKDEADHVILAHELSHFPEIWNTFGLQFTHQYFFSIETLAVRFIQHFDFLVDRGVLIDEDRGLVSELELAGLEGNFNLASQKIMELIDKLIDRYFDRQIEFDIFIGFILGYPLVDIDVMRDLREEGYFRMRELGLEFMKTEYEGIHLVTRGGEESLRYLEHYVSVLDYAYSELDPDPEEPEMDWVILLAGLFAGALGVSPLAMARSDNNRKRQKKLEAKRKKNKRRADKEERRKKNKTKTKLDLPHQLEIEQKPDELTPLVSQVGDFVYVGDDLWIHPLLRSAYGDFTALMLNYLQKPGVLKRNWAVLDLGSGDAVLEVGIANRVKRVDGVEKATLAFQRGQENIERNKIENVHLFLGDLFEPVDGRKYDLIISNPPHIPTNDEMRQISDVHPLVKMANDGGEDGRVLIEKIIRDAPQYLKKDGKIILTHHEFISLKKTAELAKNVNMRMRIVDEKEYPIQLKPGQRHVLLEYQEYIENANGVKLRKRGDTWVYTIYLIEFTPMEEKKPEPGVTHETKSLFDELKLILPGKRGDQIISQIWFEPEEQSMIPMTYIRATLLKMAELVRELGLNPTDHRILQRWNKWARRGTEENFEDTFRNIAQEVRNRKKTRARFKPQQGDFAEPRVIKSEYQSGIVLIEDPQWIMPRGGPFKAHLNFRTVDNVIYIDGIQMSHHQHEFKGLDQLPALPEGWNAKLMDALLDYAGSQEIDSIRMVVPDNIYHDVLSLTIHSHALYVNYVYLPSQFDFTLKFREPVPMPAKYRHRAGASHVVWEKDVQMKPIGKAQARSTRKLWLAISPFLPFGWNQSLGAEAIFTGGWEFIRISTLPGLATLASGTGFESLVSVLVLLQLWNLYVFVFKEGHSFNTRDLLFLFFIISTYTIAFSPFGLPKYITLMTIIFHIFRDFKAFQQRSITKSEIPKDTITHPENDFAQLQKVPKEIIWLFIFMVGILLLLGGLVVYLWNQDNILFDELGIKTSQWIWGLTGGAVLAAARSNDDKKRKKKKRDKKQQEWQKRKAEKKKTEKIPPQKTADDKEESIIKDVYAIEGRQIRFEVFIKKGWRLTQRMVNDTVYVPSTAKLPVGSEGKILGIDITDVTRRGSEIGVGHFMANWDVEALGLIDDIHIFMKPQYRGKGLMKHLWGKILPQILKPGMRVEEELANDETAISMGDYLLSSNIISRSEDRTTLRELLDNGEKLLEMRKNSRAPPREIDAVQKRLNQVRGFILSAVYKYVHSQKIEIPSAVIEKTLLGHLMTEAGLTNLQFQTFSKDGLLGGILSGEYKSHPLPKSSGAARTLVNIIGEVLGIDFVDDTGQNYLKIGDEGWYVTLLERLTPKQREKLTDFGLPANANAVDGSFPNVGILFFDGIPGMIYAAGIIDDQGKRYTQGLITFHSPDLQETMNFAQFVAHYWNLVEKRLGFNDEYLKTEILMPDVKVNDSFISVMEGVHGELNYDGYIFRLGIRPQPGADILEMGSGHGKAGIIGQAKAKGTVTFVDKYPREVVNTQYNVVLNEMEDVATVIQSDLFENIPNGKKFDHVYANLPIMPIHKKGDDSTLYDSDGSILERFFAEVNDFLKPGGTVEVSYSEDPHFLATIYKYGFRPIIIEGTRIARESFIKSKKPIPEDYSRFTLIKEPPSPQQKLNYAFYAYLAEVQNEWGQTRRIKQEDKNILSLFFAMTLQAQKINPTFDGLLTLKLLDNILGWEDMRQFTFPHIPDYRVDEAFTDSDMVQRLNNEVPDLKKWTLDHFYQRSSIHSGFIGIALPLLAIEEGVHLNREWAIGIAIAMGAFALLFRAPEKITHELRNDFWFRTIALIVLLFAVPWSIEIVLAFISTGVAFSMVQLKKGERRKKKQKKVGRAKKINRRWLIGGGLGLTLLGLLSKFGREEKKPIEKPTSSGRGKLIWKLDYHSLDQVERMTQEYKEVRAKFDEVVIFLESGPLPFTSLKTENPHLAQMLLKPGAFEDLVVIDEIQKQRQNEIDEVNRTYRLMNQAVDQALARGQNHTDINMPELFFLMTQDENVTVVSEEPSLEAHIHELERGVYSQQAIEALMTEKDEEKYHRLEQRSTEHLYRSIYARDVRNAKVIKELMLHHKEAVILVSLGAMHHDTVEWVGQADNFEIEIQGVGENEYLLWDPVSAEIHAQRHQMYEGKSILDWPKRTALSSFVWQSLVNVLSKQGMETIEARELAARNAKQIEISDLRNLISIVQEKTPPYSINLATEAQKTWGFIADLYILEWMYEHNHFIPEIKEKMEPLMPEIREKIKQSESILRRMRRGGILQIVMLFGLVILNPLTIMAFYQGVPIEFYSTIFLAFNYGLGAALIGYGLWILYAASIFLMLLGIYALGNFGIKIFRNIAIAGFVAFLLTVSSGNMDNPPKVHYILPKIINRDDHEGLDSIKSIQIDTTTRYLFEGRLEPGHEVGTFQITFKDQEIMPSNESAQMFEPRKDKRQFTLFFDNNDINPVEVTIDGEVIREYLVLSDDEFDEADKKNFTVTVKPNNKSRRFQFSIGAHVSNLGLSLKEKGIYFSAILVWITTAFHLLFSIVKRNRGFPSLAKGKPVEWGVDPEWLEKNRHRMVPIFISGGESPGVNDYFGHVARNIRKKGLLAVAVKNGIQGFVGPGIENRLAVIDEELEKEFIGQGGAKAGTSRVNLLKEEMRTDLEETLENMRGFKAYLAIGGGDHAVFWPRFAEKVGDLEDISDQHKEIAKDILSRMIVVYKTIDGDTWGQPFGFYTAMRNAQEIIYGAAASSEAMWKVTVVGIMGADVGRLAVAAASKHPINYQFLKSSLIPEHAALAGQIDTYRDQIITLIPEATLSLTQVIKAAREIKENHGSVTVVVSEGMSIDVNDPILKELIDKDSKYFDSKAAMAWQEALNAGRDAHGNVKRAEIPVEVIVASALKMFIHPSKKEGVRLAEKIGFGALRGGNPSHFDRVYARLLADKVSEFIFNNKFGVVVSLPPDDLSIDYAYIQFLNRIKLGFNPTALENKVFNYLKKRPVLDVQTFSQVYEQRESQGLFNSMHANNLAELRAASVLLTDTPYDIKMKQRSATQWETTSSLSGDKKHHFKVLDALDVLELHRSFRNRFLDIYGKVYSRGVGERVLSLIENKGLVRGSLKLLFDQSTNSLVGLYYLSLNGSSPDKLIPHLHVLVVDDGKRKIMQDGIQMPQDHPLRDLSEAGPTYRGTGAVDVLFEDMRQFLNAKANELNIEGEIYLHALIGRQKVLQDNEPYQFSGTVDQLKNELKIKSKIEKNTSASLLGDIAHLTNPILLENQWIKILVFLGAVGEASLIVFDSLLWAPVFYAIHTLFYVILIYKDRAPPRIAQFRYRPLIFSSYFLSPWLGATLHLLYDLFQLFVSDTDRLRLEMASDAESVGGPWLHINSESGRTVEETLYDRWVKGSVLEDKVKKLILTMNAPTRLQGKLIFENSERYFDIQTNGTGVITGISSQGHGYSEEIIWQILNDLRNHGFVAAYFYVNDGDDENYILDFAKKWKENYKKLGQPGELISVSEDTDYERTIVNVHLDVLNFDVMKPGAARLSENLFRVGISLGQEVLNQKYSTDNVSKEYENLLRWLIFEARSAGFNPQYRTLAPHPIRPGQYNVYEFEPVDGILVNEELENNYPRRHERAIFYYKHFYFLSVLAVQLMNEDNSVDLQPLQDQLDQLNELAKAELGLQFTDKAVHLLSFPGSAFTENDSIYIDMNTFVKNKLRLEDQLDWFLFEANHIGSHLRYLGNLHEDGISHSRDSNVVDYMRGIESLLILMEQLKNKDLSENIKNQIVEAILGLLSSDVDAFIDEKILRKLFRPNQRTGVSLQMGLPRYREMISPYLSLLKEHINGIYGTDLIAELEKFNPQLHVFSPLSRNYDSEWNLMHLKVVNRIVEGDNDYFVEDSFTVGDNEKLNWMGSLQNTRPYLGIQGKDMVTPYDHDDAQRFYNETMTRLNQFRRGQRNIDSSINMALIWPWLVAGLIESVLTIFGLNGLGALTVMAHQSQQRPYKKFMIHVASPNALNPNYVGNKGRNLTRMARLNLPVPIFFVVSAALIQDKNIDDIDYEGLANEIQNQVDRPINDKNPVAIRAAGLEDMPGVLKTVLNVKNRAELIDALKEVYASWNSEKTKMYMSAKGIPRESGMAVIVQHFIRSDQSTRSASGSLVTRHPMTGENIFYGHYYLKSAGEKTAEGSTDPTYRSVSDRMENDFPTAFKRLKEHRKLIEREFGNPQLIEFVIRNGQLFITQTVNAVVSPGVEDKILNDMIEERVILAKPVARAKLSREKNEIQIIPLSAKLKLLIQGSPLSFGAADGIVVTSVEDAKTAQEKGQNAILVMNERSVEGLQMILDRSIAGFVTRYGNYNMHDARIARSMGVPGVAVLAPWSVKPGQRVIIDGESGKVFEPQEDDPLITVQTQNRPENNRDATEIMRRVRDEFNSWSIDNLLKIHALLTATVEKAERERNPDVEIVNLDFATIAIHELLIADAKDNNKDAKAITRESLLLKIRYQVDNEVLISAINITSVNDLIHRRNEIIHRLNTTSMGSDAQKLAHAMESKENLVNYLNEEMKRLPHFKGDDYNAYPVSEYYKRTPELKIGKLNPWFIWTDSERSEQMVETNEDVEKIISLLVTLFPQERIKVWEGVDSYSYEYHFIGVVGFDVYIRAILLSNGIIEKLADYIRSLNSEDLAQVLSEDGTRIQISKVLEKMKADAEEYQQQLALPFAHRVRYAAAHGKPGAGKGTLLEKFVTELNSRLPNSKQFIILTVGDIFRKKGVFEDFEIPESAIELMKAGKLVSDDVVFEVINKALELDVFKNAHGIIFDPIPRSMGQLELLRDKKLIRNGDPIQIDFHLILDIEDETIRKRAEARRSRALNVRPDDQPDKVEKRIVEYRDVTQPAVEALRNNPETIVINGEQPIDAVYADFMSKLGKWLSKSNNPAQSIWPRLIWAGLNRNREKTSEYYQGEAQFTSWFEMIEIVGSWLIGGVLVLFSELTLLQLIGWQIVHFLIFILSHWLNGIWNPVNPTQIFLGYTLITPTLLFERQFLNQFRRAHAREDYRIIKRRMKNSSTSNENIVLSEPIERYDFPESYGEFKKYNPIRWWLDAFEQVGYKDKVIIGVEGSMVYITDEENGGPQWDAVEDIDLVFYINDPNPQRVYVNALNQIVRNIEDYGGRITQDGHHLRIEWKTHHIDFEAAPDHHVLSYSDLFTMPHGFIPGFYQYYGHSKFAQATNTLLRNKLSIDDLLFHLEQSYGAFVFSVENLARQIPEMNPKFLKRLASMAELRGRDDDKQRLLNAFFKFSEYGDNPYEQMERDLLVALFRASPEYLPSDYEPSHEIEKFLSLPFDFSDVSDFDEPETLMGTTWSEISSDIEHHYRNRLEKAGFHERRESYFERFGNFIREFGPHIIVVAAAIASMGAVPVALAVSKDGEGSQAPNSEKEFLQETLNELIDKLNKGFGSRENLNRRVEVVLAMIWFDPPAFDKDTREKWRQIVNEMADVSIEKNYVPRRDYAKIVALREEAQKLMMAEEYDLSIMGELAESAQFGDPVDALKGDKVPALPAEEFGLYIPEREKDTFVVNIISYLMSNNRMFSGRLALMFDQVGGTVIELQRQNAPGTLPLDFNSHGWEKILLRETIKSAWNGGAQYMRMLTPGAIDFMNYEVPSYIQFNNYARVPYDQGMRLVIADPVKVMMFGDGTDSSYLAWEIENPNAAEGHRLINGLGKTLGDVPTRLGVDGQSENRSMPFSGGKNKSQDQDGLNRYQPVKENLGIRYKKYRNVFSKA